MALTVVAIVGVPGDVRQRVVEALERQFPTGYLVRFRAAKFRASGLALYSNNEVEGCLDLLSDAVFGKSTRPLGFCRNSQTGCSESGLAKACVKARGATCSMLMPDRLIVAYQEGDGSSALLKRLHYAVFAIAIPRSVYGRAQATADFLIQAVSAARRRIDRLSALYTQGTCPFLLPPLNFGAGKVVEKILAEALASDTPEKLSAAFRRVHWDRKSHCFVGRSKLKFSPAKGGGRHGQAANSNDPALALSKHFRVGAAYSDTQHWDVGAGDGEHLAGRYRFYHREGGGVVETEWPKTRHANVLVDDCLR